MDRRQLESAGATYPHLYVQGLYAVPAGVIWFLIGFSNLAHPPVELWSLGVGLVAALALLAVVGLSYRHAYGRVTPTRSRRVRHYLAFAVGFAAYVGVDQLARTILGRPPRTGVSTMLSAWAVGALVFYFLSSGLRAHHVAIWGAMAVAGLLPVWGVGVDRDAIAAFPIGIATIVSGLFDHRLLVKTFQSYRALHLESTDVGA